MHSVKFKFTLNILAAVQTGLSEQFALVHAEMHVLNSQLNYKNVQSFQCFFLVPTSLDSRSCTLYGVCYPSFNDIVHTRSVF